MSKFCEEKDEPLFKDSDEAELSLKGGNLPEKQVSSMERLAAVLATVGNDQRKTSALKFSMWLLGCVLGVLAAITLLECFVDTKNEYVKDLFDFFKYISTTLVGYVCASHKKEAE